MNAKKKEPTFGEAVEAVEDILSRLDRDEIDVDDLAGEVKRAVELVAMCRVKLDRTELEVQDFVAELEGDRAEPAATEDEPADAPENPDALPF